MHEHLQQITSAFRILFHNKRLFLPEIYKNIAILPFLLVTIFVSGLADALTYLFTYEPDAFFRTIIEQKARFVPAWITFFFISFVLGSGFDSIKYQMVRDVLRKKKARFAFPERRIVFQLVLQNFIFWIITTTFLLITLFLSTDFLSSLTTPQPDPSLESLFVLLLVGILFLVLSLVVYSLSVFRFASLFTERTNALTSLRSSYRHVISDFSNSSLVVLIIGAGEFIYSYLQSTIQQLIRFTLIPFALFFSTLSLPEASAVFKNAKLPVPFKIARRSAKSMLMIPGL